MLMRYFFDRTLAQVSYLVGCPEAGQALMIDPSRNIAPYLAAAEEEGLRIAHVTETHIHADFVSGCRELAETTGARLYLSDEGDLNWKYQYANEETVLLHDGESWAVGSVKVAVMHTPGHAPEHISFVITDTNAANQPLGVFTGDFLFVGDIGRPDLLEEAVGLTGTKEIGAHHQFANVQRIKELPDYLQIWPGHRAGSACGKAIGAMPSTTLGYEKRFNPAFQFDEEDAFIEWLLDGQPEIPLYFAHMKRVNRIGPASLGDLAEPVRLNRSALDVALKAGKLVVDFRDKIDFAQAHIPNTLNVPLSGKFTTHLGWFVEYDAPFYFIVENEDDVRQIIPALRAIGVDNIAGYCLADAIVGATGTLTLINGEELSHRFAQSDTLVLDVRSASEYGEGHIRGAKHIPLGYLLHHLDDIPRDRTVITQCKIGNRAQIAASLLRKHGFEDVISLNDEFANLPKTLLTDES